MKTFHCQCGNRLFFDSISCVQCGRATTMCPACDGMTPLEGDASESFACQNDGCGVTLKLCDNYQSQSVCNRSLTAEDAERTLCDYCSLNRVIPDLSVSGNPAKWGRLEAAKRRVLFGLETLGFPICGSEDCTPQLTFEFKEDGEEPANTGHADGCITINLNEADPVEREKTRVEFGEPQRTIVGHFRHELGHYYWDLLIKSQPERLTAYRKLFGDERKPSYEDAQKKYYENGPPVDWQSRFISEYASMHSWEDFAESFAFYLDMNAILETCSAMENVLGNTEIVSPRSFDERLNAYQKIGVFANELNRDMGLLDLMPEVLSAPVVEKLRFVHELPLEL